MKSNAELPKERELDARAIQDRLRHSLKTDSADVATLVPRRDKVETEEVAPVRFPGDDGGAVPQGRDPVARPAPQPARAAAWPGRVVKTAVALAALLAVVWAPLQALRQAASAEAVVNRRVIVLRSPIEGTVATGSLPAAGTKVAGSIPIVTIENPRADSSQVNALDRDLLQLTSARPALTQRLERALAEEAALQSHIAALRDARREVLTIDLAMVKQQIEAGRQQLQIDSDEAERATTLRGKGVIPTSSASKAERMARIAESNVAQLELKQRRLELEIAALDRGINLDASYNDRTQSEQRLDEVRTEIGDLKAQLLEGDGRIAGLRASITAARALHDRQSSATLNAPQAGRVWEVLVSPGEQVNEGQDLVRLLSCEEAVVTASVTEKVYNGLYDGMPATFLPRGSDEALSGTITNLTGLSGAASNYAITPSSLVQQPYRVTVSVPQLAGESDCSVGRTGRVLFGEDANTSAVARTLNGIRSLLP